MSKNETELIIEAYIEKVGSPQESGDEDSWHTGLGYFTSGWCAHKRAAELQSDENPDTCSFCNDTEVIANMMGGDEPCPWCQDTEQV